MKTLPLLVCICALSACFSLSEGHTQQQKVLHKKINVHRYTLDHHSPFHPQFRPDRNLLIQKHFLFNQPRPWKPSNPRRKYKGPKHVKPPKHPAKNDTGVNNNTSEATTQVPSVEPTSTSTKIVPSPSVTILAPDATTTARENNGNTGLSATTPSPPSSPALPDTTAAPPISSPATAPSPATPDTTAAPPTPSPATSAPPPYPATADTTAVPPTSPPATSAPPSSQATPETTAAPPTSPPATPAPPSSPPSPETTAAPDTTPNPSPTTPDTSQTPAEPTTQTPTPAITQTTSVEQTTSSSPQDTFPQFWLALNKLWEQFWRITAAIVHHTL
nr:PREDICTED: mucin-7 [Equus przewalskii]